MSEFDNHNFKIYFSGRFTCLVDEHVETRNRLCFANGLKLQGNKWEPQSMLAQYIQRKFASLGIIKHVLSYLFDAPGYMNITLTNCVFVQTRQVCHSPDLSKMWWDIIVRLLPQKSLAYFSASCCNETSCGWVISTYIFQNLNWPDILFAVLITLHTTSDISLHWTCWWPCTVNY